MKLVAAYKIRPLSYQHLPRIDQLNIRKHPLKHQFQGLLVQMECQKVEVKSFKQDFRDLQRLTPSLVIEDSDLQISLQSRLLILHQSLNFQPH